MRVFAIAFALCILGVGSSFADPVPGHFFFNLNDGACTVDCSGGGWTAGQEFVPFLTPDDTNPLDYPGPTTFVCPDCIDPDIELDLGDASSPFTADHPFFADSNGGGFGNAIGADYQNDTSSTLPDIFLQIHDFVSGETYHCSFGAGFATGLHCGFKVDSSDPTILDVGFFGADIPPVASVPEPASLPMISLMLVGLGSLMRRKVRNRN